MVKRDTAKVNWLAGAGAAIRLDKWDGACGVAAVLGGAAVGAVVSAAAVGAVVVVPAVL